MIIKPQDCDPKYGLPLKVSLQKSHYRLLSVKPLSIFHQVKRFNAKNNNFDVEFIISIDKAIEFLDNKVLNFSNKIQYCDDKIALSEAINFLDNKGCICMLLNLKMRHKPNVNC